MNAIFCLLLWCASAFAAPCENTVSTEEVMKQVQIGEQAFEDMEQETLLIARGQMLFSLVCVEESLTFEEIASLHWLSALSYFTTDREKVLPILQVIWQMNATQEINMDVVPNKGHPLAKLFEEASQPTSSLYERLYPPQGGYVIVNGVRDAERPLGLPSIVQVFDAQGELVETRYAVPGEVLPTWGPDPLELPKGNLAARPRTWWVTSLSALAAGSVCYAGAIETKSRVLDLEDPVPDDQVPGMQLRTNLMAGCAVGLGVVAIGTGTTSLVLTRRTRGD